MELVKFISKSRWIYRVPTVPRLVHRLLGILLALFMLFQDGFSQVKINNEETGKTGREIRKARRAAFKQNNKQLFFNFGSVYASLNTEVSFELLEDFLTASLSFEDNLGLPARRSFITSSLVLRATPRSGFYVQYYGINRALNLVADKDYIFKQDTIPAGTQTRTYFNTQVVSTGYMVTILDKEEVFLGGYFNLYLMRLSTGVTSDIGSINQTISYTAPLPNFGLITFIDLKSWLELEAGVGFFSLYLDQFSGSLYDFNFGLKFIPVEWLGLSVSYREFDVRVEFPYEDINTVVDYNFRGPHFGLSLRF